ncbi:MAG: hypothetical protein JNM06_16160 [Blastocatellia bacterium]|nr:hypothetical protein [Blastocatellia bacterium]
MNSGYLKIKQRVQDFPIYQLGQELVASPTNIRSTSYQEALDKIQEIEECYSDIFGGEEWRLAYYCTAEGYGKRFSFAEYEHMIQPLCDCGAELASCLIDTSLVQEILDRMQQHQAFLFLHHSYTQITGFSIGLLLDCAEVAERAMSDCYNPEIKSEYLHTQVYAALDEYCYTHGIRGEVFYGLSGGLVPKARTGLEPVLYLYRFMLHHAYLFGQKVFFAVTHKNTPMLKIALLLSADIIYEFEDGSVMIGYHDVTPVLSLLQNLTAKEIKTIMSENERELEALKANRVYWHNPPTKGYTVKNIQAN